MQSRGRRRASDGGEEKRRERKKGRKGCTSEQTSDILCCNYHHLLRLFFFPPSLSFLGQLHTRNSPQLSTQQPSRSPTPSSHQRHAQRHEQEAAELVKSFLGPAALFVGGAERGELGAERARCVGEESERGLAGWAGEQRERCVRCYGGWGAPA